MIFDPNYQLVTDTDAIWGFLILQQLEIFWNYIQFVF